jgi:prepilin-type processing-associated H-X9-DG protein
MTEMSDAMNAEKMIEIVLCKAEPWEPEPDKRALPLDPEQTARLETLRRSVHRLLDDGSEFEHPPQLARRTLAFVAANRRRPMSLLEQVATRLPFRWADFAVAAGIFIAGTLTLLPAIHRSRERMNQAGCVFNLQQLGNSLAQYASLHPFLPYPPAHRCDAHAGMFAVILHDAGVLDNLALLDCPCNGVCPHGMKDLASFEQVDQIRKTDPDAYQRMLCWDYAYNVGYCRASSGHGGPVEVAYSSQIPVIADQPDHEDFRMIRDGNSPNHGRRGQNVLFGDGSVRWFRSRNIGPLDPDLFLNNNHEPRPGIHVSDSVLMPSKIPFEGR